MRLGQPFGNSRFLSLGSRHAVDKALSRLVKEQLIARLTRGVFFRPQQNPLVGTVMPDISSVVRVIAEQHNEIIQVHGAEAANRFNLSTQVPTSTVYYTSGTSRSIKVGELVVKFIHTTSRRKLQHAGNKVGLALSALWYLGKQQVNVKAISRVRESLSENEFQLLRASALPIWMAQAIEAFADN